jgi:hypothetical protein
VVPDGADGCTMYVPSLILTTEIVASDFDDGIQSLEYNVVSESNNNNRKRNKGRQREAASNRNDASVGPLGDSMPRRRNMP